MTESSGPFYPPTTDAQASDRNPPWANDYLWPGDGSDTAVLTLSQYQPPPLLGFSWPGDYHHPNSVPDGHVVPADNAYNALLGAEALATPSTTLHPPVLPSVDNHGTRFETVPASVTRPEPPNTNIKARMPIKGRTPAKTRSRRSRDIDAETEETVAIKRHRTAHRERRDSDVGHATQPPQRRRGDRHSSPTLSTTDESSSAGRIDAASNLSQDEVRYRNRIAAERCRSKRKDQVAQLVEEERTMEDANAALAECYDALKQEVDQLEGQLWRHQDCNCILIQTYLATKEKLRQLHG